MVSPRYQHDVSVMESHRLVQRPVFGVHPLEGESSFRPYPVVVGLFQVGLARPIIPIVLVRGIARPVAVGGDDLDDQQPLSETVLHQDGAYLPFHVSGAAYLNLDVLRKDQLRLPSLLGGRRGDRQLQPPGCRLHAIRGLRGEVEGAGSAVEHVLAFPDVPPLVIVGRDVTQPGEYHQTDLLFPRLLLQRLALSQLEDLEAYVVPSRRRRGNPNDASVLLRPFLAGYEQFGHDRYSFSSGRLFLASLTGSVVLPASVLRSPHVRRARLLCQRPRRSGRPTGTRSPGRSRGWSVCRSPRFCRCTSLGRA